MPIRYSDFRKRSDAPADFTVRRYNPSLLKMILLFFLALAAGIGITALLLPPLPFIIALTVVMAGLGTYVLLKLQRTRDLIIATEFQNALFASALGHNSRFCLILTREGAITYMDQGLQRMFPDLLRDRQISLAGLLKLGRVGGVEREKLLDAVQRGRADRVRLEMRSADGRPHPVALTLQPIARPSGFILLRGEDDAAGAAPSPLPAPAPAAPANPLLSRSSIALFAAVMDRMAMGLYLTDMRGQLLYANAVLERWLSFAAGEIAAGNLTLRDVVHGVSAQDALAPGDFEGENSLLKKQGGIIKAYVNQKIIYGDHHMPLGCVALITNMVESDSETKKRLW